jgi:hypothetical protein
MNTSPCEQLLYPKAIIIPVKMVRLGCYHSVWIKQGYSKTAHKDDPDIKTTQLLRPPLQGPNLHICTIFHPEIQTTPLLRPLLPSPDDGLNNGVSLY